MIKNLMIFSFLLCVASCGGYENLELQKTIEKKADSIFRRQLKPLNKRIDSICDLNYNKQFKEAIDSIKSKQIDEIKLILDK